MVITKDCESQVLRMTFYWPIQARCCHLCYIPTLNHWCFVELRERGSAQLCRFSHCATEQRELVGRNMSLGTRQS